jgi:hypothetical protein
MSSAARKLGDEGHHQLVLAQAGRGIGQPQGALGVDAVLAIEPVGIVCDGRSQAHAPLAVVGDFLFQVDAHVLLLFSITRQGASTPDTATVFCREVSPRTRRTADLGTPSCAASQASRCAFALLSTGGAAIFNFSRPPCSLQR